MIAETHERGCVPIICLRKGQPIPLTAIPYGSPEWERLYRGRASVEREFGRLKHDYGLTPLRVRGLERVRLHLISGFACDSGRRLHERGKSPSPPE